MKILSLKLIAYGSFTDTTLDFTGDGAGFHVIYGPNEAGKSTALEALRYMLFGIPVRTTASFLHPHPNLRIGGRLIKSDGTPIEFVRRKGRNKTLRDADDQVILGDEVLVPFLGGLNQEVFEQMFAIGHEELVKGGEEVISGGGSVGQSLFAAGAGLIQLQGTRQDLVAEYSAFFKPSGSKPVINKTLSALKETGKAQKEVLLLARTWKGHDQALQDARQRLGSIQKQLLELKLDSGKLERIGKALPLIARIKEVETKLTAYKGVPRLPEDFGEKQRKAVNDLEIAGNDLTRAEGTIQNLKNQVKTIAVPESIIRNSELIENLQHDLGSYRKAQKDRPGLEARMRTLAGQVSEKLSETACGDYTEKNKALKLSPSTVGEIQDL
ncbi:MAG: AAA family ATPase, partial [Thermodesulfobacteriota bacterium]|nr:AAA family ATPase [Thermodesulfobacteriota bacterium]